MSKTMKKITFANKKGGVSKTTSAVITAQMLAVDSSVLLIDLDSQNALTSFFFDDIAQFSDRTILELLDNKITFEDVFKITDNLHVMPCKLEFEEVNKWERVGKELLLQLALENCNYDYCIMDTGPYLNTETSLGLTAANIVILPVKLERMDTRAIDFTINKINSEIAQFNRGLEKIYILPTQYQYQNRTVNDFALQQLKEKYEDKVLDIVTPFKSTISQYNFIKGKGININEKDFDEYKQLVEVLR